MNIFTPAAARNTLVLGELARIVAGGADEKRMIAPGAARGASQFVGDRRRRRRRRIGVGHFENSDDAAEHGAARAAFKILLVLEPGLAEMHLRVDRARQHVEIGGIETLRRRRALEIADRGEAPGANADIGGPAPARQQAGAALDDQIEGPGHSAASAVSRAGEFASTPRNNSR